jgi:F0F1-type ATP synthase membrane subunit b/b'
MAIDLLNFDASVIYQLILFVLALVLISRWMIRPIFATLSMRAQLAVPAEQDEELLGRVSAKQARYAEYLQQARSESAQVRQGIRNQAISEERTLIDEAQKRAVDSHRRGREGLDSQVAQARADMQSWIPQMASELARKILGREL